MSYNLYIETNSQPFNHEGDTAKLLIMFTIDQAGTPTTWDAEEKGIRVLDWGGINSRYDFDDLLLVPTTVNLLIGDSFGELDELFFGNSTLAQAAGKEPYILIYINGAPEFAGYVQEDGAISDLGNLRVKLSVDPKIGILNKTQLFDKEGNALNPMGFEWYSVRFFTEFLEKTYQLVNPNLLVFNGTIEVVHDWKFKGDSVSTTLDDITLEEIKIFGQKLIGVEALDYGVSTAGDFLRVLARNFCAFTGMTSYGKAFFKKLFYYNSSNLQTLDIVYSHTRAYQSQKIEYVELTVHVGSQQKIYTEPGCEFSADYTTDTLTSNLHGLSDGIAGTVVTSGSLPDGLSSGKLYYIRNSTTNTFQLSETKTGSPVNITSNGSGIHSFRSLNPNIEGKYLVEDVFTGFWGLGSDTQVAATVARGGGDDGYYTIYEVADDSIDSGAYYSNGRLTAKFWRKYRGVINNMRIDTFLVKGIGYDFLKDFNHNGEKFQPIEMTKWISKNQTEIKAIFLGVV